MAVCVQSTCRPSGDRRHVCTNYRNITHPVKTKQVYCKPAFKKYMVRCGNQWCEGVRLVYEKYHKDVITNTNHTQVDYTCCPGWTQVTYRSHGCNKPVCATPCLNGGKCVRPNCCSCPPGFTGPYCETTITRWDEPGCSPPCQNGGTCNPNLLCLCPPGFEGLQCQRDVDECKMLKPCDQICYNTPGSYRCQCKENFALQKDGQSCRKENDDEGTTLEAKDLEFQRLDKRLVKLEKMITEKQKNQVSKKDLQSIYDNMDKIANKITNLSDKLKNLDTYKEDMHSLLERLSNVEQKASSCTNKLRRVSTTLAESEKYEKRTSTILKKD